MALTFPCRHCPSVWANQNLLDKHVLRKHSVENPFPYQCKVCYESFREEQHFNIHNEITSHSAAHLTTYQCNICKKTFSSTENLKKHQILHHKKPFHCNLCKKSFSTKGNLGQHQKTQGHLIMFMEKKHAREKSIPDNFVDCGETIKEEIEEEENVDENPLNVKLETDDYTYIKEEVDVVIKEEIAEKEDLFNYDFNM